MKKKLKDSILLTYVKKREDLRKTINQVLENERGAGAVEYALVIGVVVVMIIAATAVMDTPVRAFFQSVIQAVQDMIK